MSTVQINGRTYNVEIRVGHLAYVRLPNGRKSFIAHMYDNGTAVIISKHGE